MKPLINNVKGLSAIQIPRGEFTITQSGILALMGIRQNDDIDIVVSSEARHQLFGGSQDFDAQGDDNLIDNYSFQIDGYNFLEPRFYFSRKNKNTERDLKDWEGIKKFFEMENHKGYPFNKLSDEQLGIQFV